MYTADVFVSGSDQIWNSECNGGIDRAFFLDFTDSPRIAYAASMGIEAFPQGELEEAKELLSKYRAISVRERQSMEYLHSIGFPGARHVIDPSLLLNSSDWACLAGSMQKKRKYLLVYSVERFNNDFIFSYAKEIAESLNLEMRVVCSTYPVKAEKYGFAKIHALADTRAFLRLYAGADFVVASSFHGMAFAVNFNKDFVVIAPDKYSVRMESLARQLSLSHRIVKGQKTPVSELKPIDWDWVNKRLSYERKRSMEFLQKALEDCCGSA